MNILHLSKDYIKINGITSAIENMTAKDKQNSHFILSNSIEDIFYHRSKCIYLKTIIPISTLYFFSNVLKLLQICKKNNINIIHAHHRYFDFLAGFLRLLLNIKIITTVHSKVYGRKGFSYKADKFIAVSESIKKHLIDYFGVDKKKIIVINNFIDSSVINITQGKSKIIKELCLDPSNYIVGYIGRFDIKEKGIDILIEAAKLSITNKNGLVFVFIGDGIDKHFLTNETRTIREIVRIVETKNDIFNYMQIFDLFVLPSRIDPFPLVMLEIAYMKIPFLGSNVDGIAEFVDDNINGLLFESENSRDLVKKIEFLLKHRNYGKKIGEKLYNKVIENYTAEENVKKLQELYLKLYKS